MYLFIVFVYLLSSCISISCILFLAESAPAGFPSIAVGVVIVLWYPSLGPKPSAALGGYELH